MKRLPYIAAIAATLAASPAWAEGGYAGIAYVEPESFFGSDDEGGLAANGAASLGDHVQLEGGFVRLEDADWDSTHFGGHLFSRSSGFLWGGFLGYNSVSINNQGFDEWTAAIEGQFYLPRTTLSGAVSYTEFDSSTERNGWGADVEVRHFFTDDFSLHGVAGYFDPESGIITGEITTFGIGGEYRFAGSPVSVFGGWQQADSDSGDADAFNVGVRYNWNETLLDRDRSGPSLIRPLGFLERGAAGISPR